MLTRLPLVAATLAGARARESSVLLQSRPVIYSPSSNGLTGGSGWLAGLPVYPPIRPFAVSIFGHCGCKGPFDYVINLLDVLIVLICFLYHALTSRSHVNYPCLTNSLAPFLATATNTRRSAADRCPVQWNCLCCPHSTHVPT